MKLFFLNRLIPLVFLVMHADLLRGQNADSSVKSFHVNGSALITNNGISLIPILSLGKPAAIFDLSVGGKKLRFEPQFRFSLEAKPWSFIFWWRYKLVQSGKFSFSVGAHPAINFRETIIDSVRRMIARRYLTAELVPNYRVSKNTTAGLYYLYAHGLDPGTIKNTHFITINSATIFPLSPKMQFRFNPQFYFLHQDGGHGYYSTATLGIRHIHFPLSIASILNKKISSTIPGSESFIWNVSLVYSFIK